ncbi:MAG: DUF4345 domain-containing protein [Winogradskyella sp.]|uniref:DUF4345 domain-containing protein n=1 Tax=Winogradskyella sp. TaxID=1883156 RepID=UPI0025E7B23C|nr:DUF4345 domain-containing protein [Winogradskyella sp.]NRB83568.1 DUF4345 domain-containing protein [Winogradskyella sp.]
MKLSSTSIIIKIHLFISVIIVVPISLIYGFDLGDFLKLQPNSIDEYNFYKAISGLYLGFSALWLIALFKNSYLSTALLSNCIFMFGLAGGRIMSIVFDGNPSNAYLYGTIGEGILGFYGLWVLNSKYIKNL